MTVSGKILAGLLAAVLTYLTLTAFTGPRHYSEQGHFRCQRAAQR